MKIALKNSLENKAAFFKVFILFSIPSALLFFSLNIRGADQIKSSFIYQYHIPETIKFNFKKDYSVKAGSFILTNKSDKMKKFRYIKHSPKGYLFNKKTKAIKDLTLVTHSEAPEKLDSIFWAFLGSGTYHTPVKPGGSIKLDAYLNLNFYPQPRKIIKYIKSSHKYLEYHIFNPKNFPPKGKAKQPPDHIIRSISL